jgi:tetratricopeptide (TPR) repeat protein
MLSRENEMDLHDFNKGKMYFDEDLAAEAGLLLEMAASSYALASTEPFLLKAYFLEPKSLTVIVAIYRYYFYEHKHKDALKAAHRAMEVAAEKIELTECWQKLNIKILGYSAMRSMETVRFYLLALKGAGYLNLRLGEYDEGISMLEKVAELDSEDRLGAKALLETINNELRGDQIEMDEAQIH